MKLVIKTVFALLFFVQLVAFALSLPPPATQAETRSQMQWRVLRSYIDQYDLDRTCDSACVATREAEQPWLVPLAEQLKIDHATITRASIGHSIDWGFAFESVRHTNTDCALRSTPQLNRCAPTMEDWRYAGPSIASDFLHQVDATPPLYKTERPREDGDNRLSWEYHGPY